jgi:cytochrome c556
MQMKISAAALAVVAVTTVAALAHGGATGVVKQRMDAMGHMGKATEALTKIMRGQQPYNAETVESHAAAIGSHAGESLTGMFPEGSNEPPSEALPAIWMDWDRFVDLANRLEILAEGLEAAAANGLMTGDTGSMMGTDGGDSMMDGGSMMGGGMMEGEIPNPEMLAQMPADAVFNLMAQTCSACHTDFRIEKE